MIITTSVHYAIKPQLQYVSYEAHRHTLKHTHTPTHTHRHIALNALASLVLNLKHLLKVKLALSFQQ